MVSAPSPRKALAEGAGTWPTPTSRIVASVSRVTEGASYASPPGVLEELVEATAAIPGQGIEFNEKSLGFTV